MMARAPLLHVVPLLLSCAAAESEVRVREVRPARPSGCAVEVFSGDKSAMTYPAETEVARAAVRCRKREQCIEELKRQACRCGARGVYWSEVIIEDGRTEMDAHLVVPAPQESSRRSWEGASDGDVTW